LHSESNFITALKGAPIQTFLARYTSTSSASYTLGNNDTQYLSKRFLVQESLKFLPESDRATDSSNVSW